MSRTSHEGHAPGSEPQARLAPGPARARPHERRVLALQRAAGNAAVVSGLGGGPDPTATVVQRLEFERTWSGAASRILSLGVRGDPDAERWKTQFGELQSTLSRIDSLLAGTGRHATYRARLHPARSFVDAHRHKTVPHTERARVGAAIGRHAAEVAAVVTDIGQELERDFEAAEKAHAERRKQAAADEAAQRSAARLALLEKKRQDHAALVASQTRDPGLPPGQAVEDNPDLAGLGTLHVAPHDFSIAGHGGQTISSDDYSSYAASGGQQGPHYMSGLTLGHQQWEERMQVEHAEESVPGHRGHSGGYFESRYDDAARAAYDPATAYGQPAPAATDQTFHPGKHNPWQTDFNLKHRLTDGVPADSPTGAYTSVSSKFLSDRLYLEALAEAKRQAAAELKRHPDLYRGAGGRFYKNFSVTVDLGKPTGSGFEGTNGTKRQVQDLFGNKSVYDPAHAAAQAHEPTLGADGVKKAAQAAVTAVRLGHTTAASMRDYVNGQGIAGMTLAIATQIGQAASRGVAKLYRESEVTAVPDAAITGAQTGLTLDSIDPSGDNAVFAEGAGQHFPAKTPAPPFRMSPFGNDLL